MGAHLRDLHGPKPLKAKISGNKKIPPYDSSIAYQHLQKKLTVETIHNYHLCSLVLRQCLKHFFSVVKSTLSSRRKPVDEKNELRNKKYARLPQSTCTATTMTLNLLPQSEDFLLSGGRCGRGEWHLLRTHLDFLLMHSMMLLGESILCLHAFDFRNEGSEWHGLVHRLDNDKTVPPADAGNLRYQYYPNALRSAEQRCHPLPFTSPGLRCANLF